MNNFISKTLIGLAQSLAIFMWLPGILLTTSCNRVFEPNAFNNNNAANTQLPEGLLNNLVTNEIIIFCGNPGVGKSSLCNSIFQQNAFRSGVSVGRGMTLEKQEYTFEDRKYIETPGLSDVNLRNQASVEIEKALKENNNYKIVFVATLEVDRIKPDDVVTINTVCDAITVPFEYGIIFNKVTNPVIRAIQQSGLEGYLTTLIKQPSSTIIVKHDGDMLDREDVPFSFLQEREKLVNFISSLQANMIPSNKVENIDVLAYEEKVRAVETKLQEALKQIVEEDKRREYEVEQKRRDEEKRRLEKEIFDNTVKSSEKEEKTEDSQPYERVINVTRHLDLRYFLFNPGLGVLVKTEYGTFITKNTYVRTKTTKNNGTVTYSNWQIIRFQEVFISQRQTDHFEKS